ncbi:hypothetical protein [Burkholderia sp. SRS-W-2-2016]|uniref:hypothetical protein n=1 Tax=Burkholderia sp. SRS-W-2-2016 TaxID=1926878 RepID=UPI00117DB4A5|nr:hypothetical protein [Burkholderia sp. SRS-W-2-2016]
MGSPYLKRERDREKGTGKRYHRVMLSIVRAPTVVRDPALKIVRTWPAELIRIPARGHISLLARGSENRAAREMRQSINELRRRTGCRAISMLKHRSREKIDKKLSG